jgi:hypothetical protein
MSTAANRVWSVQPQKQSNAKNNERETGRRSQFLEQITRDDEWNKTALLRRKPLLKLAPSGERSARRCVEVENVTFRGHSVDEFCRIVIGFVNDYSSSHSN